MAESSGLSECLDRLAARKGGDRPLAAYRMQFHRGFRFVDARPLLDYLHALGISHLYSSPILRARAGSVHGYDITDHHSLNPEIGSEQEFRTLVQEVKARGMGVLLDIVPNHMGVGHGTNPWWQDVLENGRTSRFALYFDIDWEPLKPALRNKVLLPVLASHYGEALESADLTLHYEDGQFFAMYYDKKLPFDPQTWPLLFDEVSELRRRSSEEAWRTSDYPELENILAALRALPPNSSTDPEERSLRQREIPRLRQRLHALYQRSAEVRALVEDCLRQAQGEPGNRRSFDTLHRVLEAQAYRLAHWQVSGEEINYRRFFDINDLVGLRMENPEVFAQTHALIRQLLAEGCIDGLRLDHPDGLFNPIQYVTRLQILYAAAHCNGPAPIPPLAGNGIEQEVQDLFTQHAWLNQQAPLYVVLEKIVERGEHIPQEWPVDGTVGYEFANLVNGVFIDRRSERSFTRLYHRLIEDAPNPDDLVYESKKLTLNTALSSELSVLTHMLEEICAGDRRARDYTRKALADAIRETISCFPVYRTYIDERGNVSERDRAYINEAIARAKRRNESTTAAVFDLLRSNLLLEFGDTEAAASRQQRLYFTLKFQQLTGPVMAKGLEDTACYVYNRFVSVNEVGGHPKHFGVTVEEFHDAGLERSRLWPNSMLTTSTHDTKRSEDVRARLNVLSEMPKEWAAQVRRWRRANRAKKRALGDGRLVPDANEEYLLYQTLVGAWPFALHGEEEHGRFVARMQEYMNKAIHEAKVNVSWVNPQPEYAGALRDFIARILTPGRSGRPNLFFDQITAFVPPVQFFGALNSLSQVLLKLTSPGIPDVYQGQELFDFSLVDPDNRRPVDYELRRGHLESLLQRQEGGGLGELCEELLREYRDGRLKMWTTMQALRTRRAEAALFQQGGYVPLKLTGKAQEHVIAFVRERERQMAVVLAPRHVYALMKGEMRPPLGEVWGDTELRLPPAAPPQFVNRFTGEVLRISTARTLLCSEVFARFPIALLISK